jgi:hypothetical protein
MSYNIDITSEPVPDDDEEAWEMLETLRDLPDSSPGQHFIPLYEKLTARYPCIMEPNEDSPWSDGPLINNFGQKHALLGLIYQAVDDALPFIIQTANEMGFTVFDEQQDEIHRAQKR